MPRSPQIAATCIAPIANLLIMPPPSFQAGCSILKSSSRRPSYQLLDLEDGYDVAVLQHVLCCAEQPERLLQTVRSLLRPGRAPKSLACFVWLEP